MQLKKIICYLMESLTKGRDEAILIFPPRHCEERSDEIISLNEVGISNYGNFEFLILNKF
jgi:hypothetical protein